MSLKPCVECGQPVSTKATRCPNCGLKEPTTRASANTAPLLFASTSPGGPAVTCHECRGQVRQSMNVCPYCGVKNPGRRPRARWLVPAAVAVIVLTPVGVIVQQLVELYRHRGIDSGSITASLPSSPHLGTVTPAASSAPCDSPAPVHARSAAAAPARFSVRLAARDDRQAASVARALSRKYRFTISAYQPASHGFSAVLSPDVIGKLSCDASVKSIEADAAAGSARDPARAP